MGEVFAGRFELLDPVAEGGMGSVWVVRDRRDGQVYAGKLLRQSDAASLMRFMREQATRIDHPHLVTPVSWAGEDDRVMFTMPLVRGGSVATLIGDHGPLPASWVVELLGQAVDGITAVHAVGLVHRDLKPANLLLEATGAGRPHVRVTDFGIAVSLDEPRLTRASQVIGSPGYMAPEQLTGGDPDPRQDLFALAQCGLEMLTGVRPPGSSEVARRLARDEPGLAPLVELLLRAGAAGPADRPASASELRRELHEVTVPADPPGEPPHVFDQLALEPVQHRVLPPVLPGAPTPPASRIPARPVRPHTTSHRPRSPERWAGLALMAVGLLAAVVALWLVLTP